ncbi:protein DpdJ [Nocardia sp. 348MFTsu5.1]|uniref:protein DpdJ n=1 Tax=Nocardia sp. 348MFTsu5.1 TaxID=1172185 RepID=UPI00039B9FEC|nr:protein DpdJ [Nocardia sp. 348MFTsu5.1]
MDLGRILNDIESHELPLLSWGVSDGSLTETELEQLIQRVAPGEDVDSVIDELLDRRLLFATGVTDQRFRSRMAETVRLAVRLRQWFHGKPWTSASSLVSDARFLSRPRVVPRRDITVESLRETLRASGTDWSDRHQAAIDAILAGRQVSAFQSRALTRLSQPASGHRGTVISAGTGSGKTLAFYLPALAHLAATDRPSGVPRIIAIYPRIELLRDQLLNILITCRLLGKSAPRVGVLYGATPHDREDAERASYSTWKKVPGGLLCPIIGCLEEGCNGGLVWPTTSGSTERLVCDKCGAVVGPDVLTFTRDRIKASPPAILFTTTEMVNRELGSKAYRRVLVGDDSRSPEFVLLDEVHTYAGTHGAQVANLLRRWRAEVATPPHVVGLSATLADPIGFFADLTGLSNSNIAVIRTDPQEMVELGREYFLALRGDPASQTSLLSTTIQTALLLRRTLDPTQNGPSQGAFGSKLFVFMDDLDVTNRLYAQLLDAEGWRVGGVNRKPNGSLATLRASTGQDVRSRDEAGQVWRIAEDLGTIDRPVRIARTTSRDGGVDPQADVIVATASLEVGFDDPAVGAVIQHKAPRDPAQFIQRRGRAGRNPAMRPWTIVVLSDFGRDRLAFQSYEALFDPVVPRVALPLRNRSILKMQATWWLLDRLSRFGSGTSLLNIIDKPWKKSREKQRELAERMLSHVRGQLNSSAIDRMGKQLQRALALTDEDLRAVLWDHPRGLVPSVFPTLIRGLEVAASDPTSAGDDWSKPLKDFLPPTLFSPLQTPEIEVILPGHGAAAESEPVSQGLRMFAPGRVSYRYARNGRRDRLWVEPPLPHESDLELSSFCGEFVELQSPPSQPAVRLFQPGTMIATTPTDTTSDSSHAEWNWTASFQHDGDPVALDMPKGTPWGDVVESLQAFTHRHRCAQTVWRYADRFTVRRNDDSAPPVTQHTVSFDGSTVSVGFVIDVDGLALTVRLPDAPPADRSLLQSLRVARMEYLIRNGDRLSGLVPSAFTRDWLHQILLSVLVIQSEAGTIEDTLASLSDDRLIAMVVDAAREVFGVLDVGTPPGAGSGRPDSGLVVDLGVALRIPGVTAELRDAAEALSGGPTEDWREWLDERYSTTLATALVEAIQLTCPEVDASDLRIDLALDESSDLRSAVIYLNEDEPGGLGVIESFIDNYGEDPRRFWSLVDSGLGPCDGERVDENVRSLLRQATSNPIAGLIAEIRSAHDLATLTVGWQKLRTCLFEIGLACDHAIVSALSTRILRPGSGPGLDALTADLIARWDAIESRVGFDVELRVFAYVAASDSEIRRRLQSLTQGHSGEAGWEVGQIVALLWPRGYRLRSSSLQTYSPFRSFEPTDRLLFSNIVQPPESVVDGTTLDWRDAVDMRLREAANAMVRVPTDAIAADVVRAFLTEPTVVDVLEFHPRVTGLSRSVAGVDIRVELREARQ